MPNKNVLLILRHEKSLNIMKEFAAQNGFDILGVALDPIEAPDLVETVLNDIRAHLPQADAVAIGTKVYNTDKEVSRLPEFVQVLKNLGMQEQPLCMTHLSSFDPAEIGGLQGIYENLSWVEEDNIGRHGPERFGQLILDALKA